MEYWLVDVMRLTIEEPDQLLELTNQSFRLRVSSPSLLTFSRGHVALQVPHKV